MTTTSGARLRVADRLRRAADFRRVFREGVRVDGRWLSVVAAQGRTGRLRVGLAVGRKVGGAVARNRVKRLVRESARQAYRDVAFDVVVLARAGTQDRAQTEIAAEYARLLERVRRRLPEKTRKALAGG